MSHDRPPQTLLRPGLLDGVALLAVQAQGEAGLSAVGARLARELGADVAEVTLERAGDAQPDEARAGELIGAALGRLGRLDVLLIDGAASFAAGGGQDALLACLALCWDATRAAAEQAFLAGDGGRVLLLAPAPDAGTHAGAALAALENLARTLSIEWARHGVTVVTVAPGAATSAEEVASVAAYLSSPAGSYFSGCLLDMRGAV